MRYLLEVGFLVLGLFRPHMVVAGGGAVELTLENWEAKRGSRNAFVKFQAPWYVS